MIPLTEYPKEALLYFLNQVQSEKKFLTSLTKEELIQYISQSFGLRGRVEEFIETLPIFRDAKFIDCWDAAFPHDGTMCLKTSFGACAYDANDKLIAMANNKRIGACLGIEAPFCDETHGCIRQTIKSRADQVIGECNHSIVWLLRELFDQGITPRDLENIRVYEAGFFVSKGYKPWWRKVENYTCLYCVRIFLTFGLLSVWGTVGEEERALWRELSVPRDYVELAQKEIREGELR
jgi:hypothetical protein